MFNGVVSKGNFVVFVSFDTIPQVIVEAESNLLYYISTEVQGNNLVIKTRNDRCIDQHMPIKVFVKTPQLSKLEICGSGSINSDDIFTNYVELEISGSGNISATTTVETIDAKISGSGNIYLNGNAHETEFKITGSGSIYSYDLFQEICFSTISGSGNIYVNVSEMLDVQIFGSGSVYYIGNPLIINTSILGSGSVYKY